MPEVWHAVDAAGDVSAVVPASFIAKNKIIFGVLGIIGLFVVLILVAAVGIFLFQQLRPIDSAAMFRANLQRAGVYHTTGVPELNELMWKFKTEEELLSSPAVADGVVYFGSGGFDGPDGVVSQSFYFEVGDYD